MGSSYIKELQLLDKTFATVVDLDINALCSAINLASALPLYVIGSGGSLSIAHLVAYIHQRFTSQLAKAVTPLEAIDLNFSKKCCIWLISAGGKNVDINDVLKDIVLKEPEHLLVTCATTKSPLAEYARNYNYTDVFDFDLPTGRDGFLATNSLIAFATLFVRAYQWIFLHDQSTPDNINSLVNLKGDVVDLLSYLRELCVPLWEKEHLLVLYGPATLPAAFDLESKFSEAALGSVLLADYRNF
ncbi:MAG: sucrose-6-phosphate hydrolase, partial [Dethiobacteria bacterium]|nr:sucrose-6-phosphate hydrolase [Dethiobacteria bacterium]